MAITQRIRNALKSLAGVSEYSSPPVVSTRLDSPDIIRARESQGGQLQRQIYSQTRWFLSDIETAQLTGDGGDMAIIGRLARSMLRDGFIRGLLSTRTSGLIALPKKFDGDKKYAKKLSDRGMVSSLFDEMYPPAELSQFLADYIQCGVACGEFVPVVGRTHKVFVRREPEFLRYRWNEDRWYFSSVGGLIPVTPGEGWMLLTAASSAPWNHACWQALGREFILKEHSKLARANFAGKLANPAIVGTAAAGAGEVERNTWVDQLIAWGLNTVFQLPVGWDIKILETNGRGWEVFGKEIEDANLEIMIILAGSKVLVDGGTGFSNAGIHAAIRADLINSDAQALAHCINTQGLPAWMVAEAEGDEGVLDDPVRVEWVVAPAADRAQEATALKEASSAAKEAVAAFGENVDLDAIAGRFGVPMTGPAEMPEPEPPPGTVPPGTPGGGGKPPKTPKLANPSKTPPKDPTKNT